MASSFVESSQQSFPAPSRALSLQLSRAERLENDDYADILIDGVASSQRQPGADDGLLQQEDGVVRQEASGERSTGAPLFRCADAVLAVSCQAAASPFKLRLRLSLTGVDAEEGVQPIAEQADGNTEQQQQRSAAPQLCSPPRCDNALTSSSRCVCLQQRERGPEAGEPMAAEGGAESALEADRSSPA
jgi:hypothetical protein